MAGQEKWWSPKGVAKDATLQWIVLPAAVIGVLAALAIGGAFG